MSFIILLVISITLKSSRAEPVVESSCVLTDCNPLPIHEPWCPSEQVMSVSSRQVHLGVLMLCCKCMRNTSEARKYQQKKILSSRNRLKQDDAPKSPIIENKPEAQLRILDGSRGQQNEIVPITILQNQASRHQFPYIVSLQINGVHKCGGVIIDNLHILTASHCFSIKDQMTRDVIGLNLNVTGITVVAGEHILNRFENSEQIVQVSSIRIHPRYNFESYQMGHDIALLTLSRCLKFITGVVQPADFLPEDLSLNYEIRALSRATQTTVAGWGGIGLIDNRGRELASNVLLTTNLNVQRCTEGYFRGIPSSVICALGENELGMSTDACQGDSGGPMECVIDNGNIKYVCGIVSYGEMCPVSSGKTPGVYSRISYYRRFIRRVLEDDYQNNINLNC